MFGFSFSELVVLIVVAVVVIGPKDLPRVLRKLGQYAGKARRMAADLRAQSGIDDVLRTEGLAESVQEIRKLARGEIADLDRKVRYDAAESKLENVAIETRAMRDREYPRDGSDVFGALPDTALVYEGSLPRSELAKDPLWRTGDKDGVIPPDPRAGARAGPRCWITVRTASHWPTASSVQMRPMQARPTQMRPMQARPTQMRPMQARPTQMRPMRPKQREPTKPTPTRHRATIDRRRS